MTSLFLQAGIKTELLLCDDAEDREDKEQSFWLHYHRISTYDSYARVMSSL